MTPLDETAARLEGLLERANLARMALTAMQCDNPMKSYPTSYVYPQAVRNSADTMQAAIDALLSERRALKERYASLVDAIDLYMGCNGSRGDYHAAKNFDCKAELEAIIAKHANGGEHD